MTWISGGMEDSLFIPRILVNKKKSPVHLCIQKNLTDHRLYECIALLLLIISYYYLLYYCPGKPLTIGRAMFMHGGEVLLVTNN